MPAKTKRRRRHSTNSVLHFSNSSRFKPNSSTRRNSSTPESNLPLHSPLASEKHTLSSNMSNKHPQHRKPRSTPDPPPLAERLSTFKAHFMAELRSSVHRTFNISGQQNQTVRPCALRNRVQSSLTPSTKSKRKPTPSNSNQNTATNSKASKRTTPRSTSKPNKPPPKSKPSKCTSKRVPEIRAFVPRDVLEGGNAPPFRRNFWTRVFTSLHPNTEIKVESLPGRLSASVLYAPEYKRGQPPFIPTTLISSSPRKSDSKLVYRDSPYEIRVAGMSVRNYDRWGPNGDNELLMYSVQTDPTTMASDGQSLPYIHFDFRRDGCSRSEQPNTYIPIPASKSYVMGSTRNMTNKTETGAKHSARVLKKNVNVQFRILELDQPNEMVRSAVKGIDQLGGMVAGFSSIAPMLGVLSPALGLASSVSKQALDSYASPDKVISIDMDFLLADRNRVRQGTAASGEYLQYGYYFFLEQPVEARLYGSVKTAKNLQLMLRRMDGGGRRFLPLTDVSYLVVRVIEPTEAAKFNRRPILMNHATQLENIFHQSSLVDDPEQLRTAVTSLGKELGVLPDDDDDDDAPQATMPNAE